MAIGLFVAGCHSAPPAAPAPVVAPPRFATLTAGTPIQLVLLDELTSGGSDKGSEVRLALYKPIEGLPALSPVKATISQSRTEGTLGALMNQPARLALELQSLTGPNGEEIAISADPKEAKEFELNRENTGRPEAKDLPVPDSTDEAPQLAVKELIERGQTDGLDAKQVGALARKLGMSETANLADSNRLNEAQNLLKAVRGGQAISGLASGGTVAAAMELVNLAGDVAHRVGKSLGGRNIRAYPGTVIDAYILKDSTVRLP